MSSDSQGHAGSHAEPNYIAVFIVLTVFTVLEVAVVGFGLSRAVLVATLVGLALVKAILVAAFFMHLKFERRTLAVIAAIPLVLCTFLLLMLMPDAH